MLTAGGLVGDGTQNGERENIRYSICIEQIPRGCN